MAGESSKKAELKNIEKLKEEARRCGYHPGDITQLENYQEDSQEYDNYLSRLNKTTNEYEYNSVLGRLMLQYAEYQLRLINEECESNLILFIFLMEVYQEVQNPDMYLWGKAGEEYLHNWSNLPEEKEPSEDSDSTPFSSDEMSTDDDEREDESQNRSNNDRCCPDGTNDEDVTRSTES